MSTAPRSDRSIPRQGSRALDEYVLPKLARATERAAMAGTTAPDAEPCSLAVVLVGWDRERTRDCVRAVTDIVRACAGVVAEIVVVANRPAAVEQLEATTTVVHGSNECFEFGGYDEGLAWFDARRSTPDCYLVMNDRALVHEPNVVTSLTAEVIRFAARAGVVAEVDPFLDGTSHDVLGRRIRSWARSSALLVSPDARRRLGPMVSISARDAERWLPSSWPGDGWTLSCVAGIDRDYARFVHKWLTGEHTSLRSSWYGATPVSEQSWPTYSRKVHAILNEHQWSVRCYDADVAIVPVHAAGVLTAFAPDSERLAALLSWLRQDPVAGHHFVGSWRGRIDIARQLACDRSRIGPSPRRNRGATRRSRSVVTVPRMVVCPRAEVRTRGLYGFEFISDTNFDHTVARILGPQPADGLLPLVVTPNVDDLVRLDEPRYADLASAERRARYVLPDGQPIVWSSRLLGRPLAARLPGASLFPRLWSRVVEEKRRALVVASDQEVAEGLRREHPPLGVVVPPQFDADDADAVGAVVQACREELDALEPEIVIFGIGFPKQQRVALSLMDQLESEGRELPLFLLLGGALDMHLGRVSRAPEWMQRAGLEWFYRFMQEPRRLFRRYFVTDPRFVSLFVRELRSGRGSVPRTQAVSAA